MKRNIKKQFWVNEEEDRELKREAKLVGLPEATLLRMLIRAYKPKEKPDNRFYACMKQVYGISSSLNQLVTIANKYKAIDSFRLANAIEDIIRFVLEIENHFLASEKRIYLKGNNNEC